MTTPQIIAGSNGFYRDKALPRGLPSGSMRAAKARPSSDCAILLRPRLRGAASEEILFRERLCPEESLRVVAPAGYRASSAGCPAVFWLAPACLLPLGLQLSGVA